MTVRQPRFLAMTGPLHLYPILHPKICNTISIKPKVSFLTVCKLNMKPGQVYLKFSGP